MSSLSACGLVCDDCEFYGKQCSGCHQVKGMVFWASQEPGKTCRLYKCAVIEKNYANCGSCKDLPCQMFRDMRDPSISIEEHEKGITARVLRLKSM